MISSKWKISLIVIVALYIALVIIASLIPIADIDNMGFNDPSFYSNSTLVPDAFVVTVTALLGLIFLPGALSSPVPTPYPGWTVLLVCALITSAIVAVFAAKMLLVFNRGASESWVVVTRVLLTLIIGSLPFFTYFFYPAYFILFFTALALPLGRPTIKRAMDRLFNVVALVDFFLVAQYLALFILFLVEGFRHVSS